MLNLSNEGASFENKGDSDAAATWADMCRDEAILSILPSVHVYKRRSREERVELGDRKWRKKGTLFFFKVAFPFGFAWIRQ